MGGKTETFGSAGKPDDFAERLRSRRRPLPPVRWPEEFENIPPPEQLVAGLLIADSMSLIYGAPKSGKTFWLLDLALHIAHGLPWNGRTVRRGLVVYAAGEAPTGVMFRVKAWHLHHGLKMAGASFALLPAAPDLFHDDGHTNDFIKMIKNAEDHRGQKACLTAIDTVHRALNGGNDSTSEDMGALIANVELVRNECELHVALLHHAGKDAGRGSRGSNALPAAVSTIIEIQKDAETGDRSAVFIEQRDLPDGNAFPFRLQPVELGMWNGMAATSLVVTPATDNFVSSDSREKKTSKLKNDAVALLRLIEVAVADGRGKLVSPLLGMTPLMALDRREVLRPWLVTRGWFSDALLSPGPGNLKAVLRTGLTHESNHLRALERRGLVAYTGEWAWLL